MIVLPVPELITQMTSILTKKRYKYDAIYVDQATQLCFLSSQANSTIKTSLKGKEAYKQFASSHSIVIRGYHADNGIFKANGQVNHYHTNKQSLTFAAVNVQDQNRIAEHQIK